MTDEPIEKPLLTEEERTILRQCCEETGVPIGIVERMIAEETQLYGMGRRHGIWETLELLVAEGIQLEQEDATS